MTAIVQPCRPFLTYLLRCVAWLQMTLGHTLRPLGVCLRRRLCKTTPAGGREALGEPQPPCMLPLLQESRALLLSALHVLHSITMSPPSHMSLMALHPTAVLTSTPESGST